MHSAGGCVDIISLLPHPQSDTPPCYNIVLSLLPALNYIAANQRSRIDRKLNENF